jgi:hypothetical protein
MLLQKKPLLMSGFFVRPKTQWSLITVIKGEAFPRFRMFF